MLHCIRINLRITDDLYEQTWNIRCSIFNLLKQRYLKRNTSLSFPMFWLLWAYLMNVNPEILCAQSIWYIRFYFSNISLRLSTCNRVWYLAIGIVLQNSTNLSKNRPLWNSTINIILAILFMPFGFLTPNDFKIIWLSNILTLSVPHEGYSSNASFPLNLISTFLLLVSIW